MAQQQLDARDYTVHRIVPVCRELQIPCGDISVVVQKYKYKMDIVFKRGTKMFKLQDGTWDLLLSVAKDIDVALLF